VKKIAKIDCSEFHYAREFEEMGFCLGKYLGGSFGYERNL
jgi:hypothetical protein